VFGSVGFVQISQHRMASQENRDRSDKNEDLRARSEGAKPKNHGSYPRETPDNCENNSLCRARSVGRRIDVLNAGFNQSGRRLKC
jgi:hypothetical protein